MNRRMRAVPVFLAYMAINGFFSRMMGAIFSVFLILRLGLGPFELVLLGTVLEGSYLLFETPTGGDTISRRTSIVIGLTGGGVGFLLLALSHSFWMAAASQLIWDLRDVRERALMSRGSPTRWRWLPARGTSAAISSGTRRHWLESSRAWRSRP